MNEIKLKNFSIRVQGKKYNVIEYFNWLGSMNSLQFDIYRRNKFFTKAFGTQPNRKEVVKAAIEKELQTLENTRLVGLDVQEVQPLFDKIRDNYSARGMLIKDIKISRKEKLYEYEEISLLVQKFKGKTLLTLTTSIYDEPKKTR